MSADHLKDLADVGAGTITVGALLGWLPAAAAVLSIVWTCIRIYEWYNGRETKD